MHWWKMRDFSIDFAEKIISTSQNELYSYKFKSESHCQLWTCDKAHCTCGIKWFCFIAFHIYLQNFWGLSSVSRHNQQKKKKNMF